MRENPNRSARETAHIHSEYRGTAGANRVTPTGRRVPTTAAQGAQAMRCAGLREVAGQPPENPIHGSR